MATSIQVAKRVRFNVADVVPATIALPEVELQDMAGKVIRNKILEIPDKSRKVLQAGDFHPLIAAAFLAFKQHHPLVLSPDMLWLTILQGVAQHVQNHSETLRHRLVQHETKIELVVESALSSWPQKDSEMREITRNFEEKIRQHTPADKHFLFKTEFSTTTDADRIAQSVALMDTFQPYFDYVVYCVCGIPSVTLEGDLNDWILLRAKVQSLQESDLELSWWTKYLLPLCEHFIRAVQGNVDRDHWGNLCKVIQRYGEEDLNAWLLKFIPYVKHNKNEPAIHQNRVLEQTVFPDPTGSREELSGKITGCTSEMLPSGLSRAPVKFKWRNNDKSQELEFVAGFVGVEQSADDLSLRPLIGWAISEGATIDKCISRLELEHEVLQPHGKEQEETLRQIFKLDMVPADVWRFYSKTNGAIVDLPGLKKRCRILPVAEIGPAWDRSEAVNKLKNLQKEGHISVQEMTDQTEFHQAYGKLRLIAELDDGRYFLFGGYPELCGFGRRDGPWPSQEELHARVVFLWTGVQKKEAFTLAAPGFSEWLEALLDGSLVAENQ